MANDCDDTGLLFNFTDYSRAGADNVEDNENNNCTF